METRKAWHVLLYGVFCVSYDTCIVMDRCQNTYRTNTGEDDQKLWEKLKELYDLLSSMTTYRMRFSLWSFWIICSLSPLFASVLNIKSTVKWTKMCEGTKGRTKSSQHLSIYLILQWTHVTTFLNYSAMHASWQVEATCIFKPAKDHIDLSCCVFFSHSCKVNLGPISGPYTSKIKFDVFHLRCRCFLQLSPTRGILSC